jgi:hypothetical protein
LTATVQQTEDLRLRSRTRRISRWTGGVEGNARLTAAAGAVLLVLLAAEGATIPWIRPLLSVHVFVGMLLLGPVALKLAVTGYRFARYYGGARDYVAKGPPAPLMRVIVAPVLVLSTLVLLGTGVALVAIGPGRGAILGLHKASFVVWFGATSIHVLVYVRRTVGHAFADWGRERLGGAGLRTALVVGAVAVGVVFALLTLPLAGPWTHWHAFGDR